MGLWTCAPISIYPTNARESEKTAENGTFFSKPSSSANFTHQNRWFSWIHMLFIISFLQQLCSRNHGLVLRARVYPRIFVFLLSHLSQGEKKGEKREGFFCPKEGTRSLFVSRSKTCDNNPRGFQMTKSPQKTDNTLTSTHLQNAVTDVTAKNTKLLGNTRVRVRVRRENHGNLFTLMVLLLRPLQ